MFTRNRTILGLLAGAALSFALPTQVVAQTAPQGVKNIVLVHGAFADGSSWNKVIPQLEAKGYNVISVQNPLTSLADDVAATKRAIALQDGPVLLVGHSWGGTVISEAGNDPKVAGLVYIAAFAPDNNESVADQGKDLAPAPGGKELRPDASGFLSLTWPGVKESFAQDLPVAERRLIYVTQGPIPAANFATKISTAAWHNHPSWYLVASEDRMINPELERRFAKKINATTLEIKASHVPMVSQPNKVADFIITAAKGAAKTTAAK